jgi:hypothetical protein
MYKLHNFYIYIQLQQRGRQTMKSNQVELTLQSAVLSIGFIILKWINLLRHQQIGKLTLNLLEVI